MLWSQGKSIGERHPVRPEMNADKDWYI